MSILYSMIRIIPASLTLRRVTYGIATFFGMMWAAQVIMISVLCTQDRSWESMEHPHCNPGRSVAILEMTSKVPVSRATPEILQRTLYRTFCS